MAWAQDARRKRRVDVIVAGQHAADGLQQIRRSRPLDHETARAGGQHLAQAAGVLMRRQRNAAELRKSFDEPFDQRDPIDAGERDIDHGDNAIIGLGAGADIADASSGNGNAGSFNGNGNAGSFNGNANCSGGFGNGFSSDGNGNGKRRDAPEWCRFLKNLNGELGPPGTIPDVD